MASVNRKLNYRLRNYSEALAASLFLIGTAIPTLVTGTEPWQSGVSVSVSNSRFRFKTGSGTELPLERMIGATLVVSTEDGTRVKVRIDSAEPDPKDALGEVVLYEFSVQNPDDGSWQPYCEPDPDGRRTGFPIASHLSPSGGSREGGFFITCTGGAYGKCIRFGYRPWLKNTGAELYQSCVRMVRADYCGDDVGHTRNGTPINIYDKFDIQKPDDVPKMSFEAGWGPDGAVCVSKTRIPELFNLEQLRASCPRLAADEGVCNESTARARGALLFNQSY